MTKHGSAAGRKAVKKSTPTVLQLGQEAQQAKEVGENFNPSTYLNDRGGDMYEPDAFNGESERLVDFLRTLQVTPLNKKLAKALVSKLIKFTPGEDSGAGDRCDDSDCTQHFPSKFHSRKNGLSLCPFC